MSGAPVLIWVVFFTPSYLFYQSSPLNAVIFAILVHLYLAGPFSLSLLVHWPVSCTFLLSRIHFLHYPTAILSLLVHWPVLSTFLLSRSLSCPSQRGFCRYSFTHRSRPHSHIRLVQHFTLNDLPRSSATRYVSVCVHLAVTFTVSVQGSGVRLPFPLQCSSYPFIK